MPEACWLGRVAYSDALAQQLAAREAVWRGEPGVVLVCDHPPTITLGRSAERSNILASDEQLARAAVSVEQIERGGDVTYHGPGQIMIYPIVRIRGVVEFLATVASAITDAIAAIGVHGAAWQRDPAGVWIGDAKIAACGIHVARGVSIHGFALDVATPREMWALIRPCGLSVPQINVEVARGAPLAADAREALARDVAHRVSTALAT